MSEFAEGQENEQDDDLFEHHRIVADKGQGLVRIDKFLFDRLEKHPVRVCKMPVTMALCASTELQ